MPRLSVLILCLLPLCLLAEPAPRPSVLILPAGRTPDFTYLQELHAKGFDIDYGLSEEKPLTWDRLRQFNCLLLTSLPMDKPARYWRQPPYRDEFAKLLARFQTEGGGVLLLLDTWEQLQSPFYETWNADLATWGAKLPLEGLHDPVTDAAHPHALRHFMYTSQVLPSPVSEGVHGTWYPCGAHSGNTNFQAMGQPLLIDNTWQVVLKGSPTSYAERIPAGFALRPSEHFTPIARDGRTPEPPLFAIRDHDGARMGFAILNPVFHVISGTTWAHDRVMLGKGMHKRPSDFDKLLENSLRWVSAPSLASGKLGGYAQDPLVLKHPHFRKAPTDFFPLFDSYQNPVPARPVFRGLVGARTAYSSGQGTVADYAAAATRAKLDFVVFLEDYEQLDEAELTQLEADCKAQSTDKLALIPGYTMRTNIGNHVFFIGWEHRYPTGNQLTGKTLRVQNFDDQGRMATSDEAAKNHIWHYVRGLRNVGYFDFAESDPGSVPVRNLRLYGMLGAVTYRHGKFIEDVTADYLKLTPQGNPPRMCAVDLVDSPAELEAAVAAGHYLSHVAADNPGDIMARMVYGHAYGRDNTYASSGPEIHAWAGTQRVFTFAGEPFVTSRYRIPHLASVTSPVGLKELRIYSDGQLWRRIALNGEKSYEHTFQWSFDRQRGLVLEVLDVNGGRAVSPSFETWTDSNAMSWCGDRQNGELWHGPFTIHAAWGSGVLTWYSVGHTWDGGGALTPFAGLNFRTLAALWDKDGKSENARGHLPRAMEGYTRATCVDDTVRNIAGDAWNIYAPGVVANAYHTLGPIKPAEQMRYSIRRTMYLPRKTGPLLDWHAMWSERSGGGLALFEGTMTTLRDTQLGRILPGTLYTINFDDSDRIALWAVRKDSATPPVCGTMDSILTGSSIRRELGTGGGYSLPIGSGGYVGTFGLSVGTPSALFNVGDRPLEWEPRSQRLFITGLPPAAKAGDTFSWRLLYLWDGFDHEARNLARLERIRAYYGLDGGPGSGIVVKRGKLLGHLGIVDLAPADGIVEFEVPQPDFRLDMPLGLRFIGFNPNWTVSQLQLTGYSMGYYTNGRNVYRDLGVDDRGMVHLGVYTWGVPLSHSVVGHPVQCDAPDLAIQVTPIGDQPHRWYVAVNNPTDHSIKTTLRKTMELPGFDFPDTPVELAPGAYQVLLDQTPPPPPKRVSKTAEAPDFFAQVDRDGGKALSVALTGVGGATLYQAGAYGRLTATQKSTDEQPLRFQVSFDARHVDGGRRLAISRPWGGSKPAIVALTDAWQHFTVEVECDARFIVDGLFFCLAQGYQAADGTFELDNVSIRLGKEGPELIANGTLDQTLDHWKAYNTTWHEVKAE